MLNNILITGGGGYIGSLLAIKLSQEKKNVVVFDTFWYAQPKILFENSSSNIKIEKADIRDIEKFNSVLSKYKIDVVIHLACVSNDPSYELDPVLGKSINYDCFEDLVKISKNNGVKRFIYASSSSVYGIKEEDQVTENLSLEPLTDYSKYKALCEEILLKYKDKNFAVMIVRPATVCGFSQRLRLDLSVNILTMNAYFKNKIIVFGGEQYRPNLNILDMVEFYSKSLDYNSELINGEIFNVGYENLKIKDIALLVQQVIRKKFIIETISTDDNRSYRISSEKIKNKLGFAPKYSVEDAIKSLYKNFENKNITNPFNSEKFFNVQVMKKIYAQK